MSNDFAARAPMNGHPARAPTGRTTRSPPARPVLDEVRLP